MLRLLNLALLLFTLFHMVISKKLYGLTLFGKPKSFDNAKKILYFLIKKKSNKVNRQLSDGVLI